MQVTQEQVEHYFELLGNTLTSLDIPASPENIFNCDETGFDGHVIGKEKSLVIGKQHLYQLQMLSNVGHITLQLAVNASDRYIPPMLIFSKSLPRDINGLPNNWKLTTSKSGYMDSTLFVKWLEEVFVPKCGRSRHPEPLMLLKQIKLNFYVYRHILHIYFNLLTSEYVI